jgi:Xaa-Pro dipeptidase
MAEAGLDALVCRLPENVLMLSGYWPLIGMSFLIMPAQGRPVVVLPRSEEREAKEELWEAERATYLYGVLGGADPYEAVAAVIVEKLGSDAKRVGFEGGFESVAPPWNAGEPSISAAATLAMLERSVGRHVLVDATDLLYALRARKTGAEQEGIRRASEIAALGLRTFQETADRGRSGVDLVAHVELAVMLRGTGFRGARRVRAFAQVSTGMEETSLAYRPAVVSTLRPLVGGDPAVLELAVVADGFWADRTRSVVVGKPTARQRAAHEAVREAKRAAIARVRPGARAADVDEAARSVMRGAGFEREFLHITGHGLGFRYHEPVPVIAPGATTILEEGMVHSVEPGAYAPDIGGIRLEDDILVTPDGAEILGPCGDDLAPGMPA